MFAVKITARRCHLDVKFGNYFLSFVFFVVVIVVVAFCFRFFFNGTLAVIFLHNFYPVTANSGDT